MTEIRIIPATMGRLERKEVYCNGKLCPFSNLQAITESYYDRIYSEFLLKENKQLEEKLQLENEKRNAYYKKYNVAMKKLESEYPNHDIQYHRDNTGTMITPYGGTVLFSINTTDYIIHRYYD